MSTVLPLKENEVALVVVLAKAGAPPLTRLSCEIAHTPLSLDYQIEPVAFDRSVVLLRNRHHVSLAKSDRGDKVCEMLGHA